MDIAKMPIFVLLSISKMHSSRSVSFSNLFCVKSNFRENGQSSRSFIKRSLNVFQFEIYFFKGSSKNSLR